MLRRNGLVSTFCNEICRANRLEPSERRPSEDEYHDGHVGQHAKDGDDIKQASFGRTACRAAESPRSVARPAASAESQIGADNHFWPVLFVVCANFSAWPVCCWVTLSTPRLHQANRSLSFFTLCVLDDVTSLMYVVIIHSTDAIGPPLRVVRRRIGSQELFTAADARK